MCIHIHVGLSDLLGTPQNPRLEEKRGSSIRFSHDLIGFWFLRNRTSGFSRQDEWESEVEEILGFKSVPALAADLIPGSHRYLHNFSR